MGRGRAKAKQAKVARQLKYSGAGTDLDALRKELLSGAPSPINGAGSSVDDDEMDDEYDDLDEDEDEDEDDEDLDGSDADDFGGYGTGRR